MAPAAGVSGIRGWGIRSRRAGDGDGVAAALVALGGDGVELESGGGAGDEQAEAAGPEARGGRGEGGQDDFVFRIRIPGRWWRGVQLGHGFIGYFGPGEVGFLLRRPALRAWSGQECPDSLFSRSFQLESFFSSILSLARPTSVGNQKPPNGMSDVFVTSRSSFQHAASMPNRSGSPLLIGQSHKSSWAAE